MTLPNKQHWKIPPHVQALPYWSLMPKAQADLSKTAQLIKLLHKVTRKNSSYKPNRNLISHYLKSTRTQLTAQVVGIQISFQALLSSTTWNPGRSAIQMPFLRIPTCKNTASHMAISGLLLGFVKAWSNELQSEEFLTSKLHCQRKQCWRYRACNLRYPYYVSYALVSTGVR